jgi:hypothetical protein
MEEVKMEQRFRELLSKLILLGYSPYERKTIIQETVGKFSFQEMSGFQRSRAIKNLEKYALLGTTYIRQYSK